MNARKKPAAQGAPAPQAQAEQAPQTAQDRPQGPPPALAAPEAPAQAAAPGRARIPGAPRNYSTETRTAEQAAAELGPNEFLWPYAGPVHGIAGLYKQSGFAAQQATGGEQAPEEILGDSGEVLLVLISNAKFLAMGEVVQNALIAVHEEFGNFYLRCVRHPRGGFLIGIIDDYDATYSACEWYDTAEECAEAWNEWAALCAS